MMDFLASIVPEFTTSPITLTRPVDSKKRGLSEVDNGGGLTTILMPKVRNALPLAMFLPNEEDNSEWGICTEYDALVCSMQLFLIFLCVGDGMEFNDVHPFNILLSPSITFLHNRKYIERSPKITLIDAGLHHLSREDRVYERPFSENVDYLFRIMHILINILDVDANVDNFATMVRSYDRFNEKRLSYIRYDGMPKHVNFNSEFRFYIENIFNPLMQKIDGLVEIPNIYDPVFDSRHTPKMGDMSEYSIDNPYNNKQVTVEWKRNRDKIISDLRARLEYMVNLRCEEMRCDRYLTPFPTWKLDTILLDREIDDRAKKSMRYLL
jgi:hypothetical protein